MTTHNKIKTAVFSTVAALIVFTAGWGVGSYKENQRMQHIADVHTHSAYQVGFSVATLAALSEKAVKSKDKESIELIYNQISHLEEKVTYLSFITEETFTEIEDVLEPAERYLWENGANERAYTAARVSASLVTNNK